MRPLWPVLVSIEFPWLDPLNLNVNMWLFYLQDLTTVGMMRVRCTSELMRGTKCLTSRDNFMMPRRECSGERQALPLMWQIWARSPLVRDYVPVCPCACVPMWPCEHVTVWRCNHVTICIRIRWPCSHMTSGKVIMWTYGHVTVWLYCIIIKAYVITWLSDHVTMSMWLGDHTYVIISDYAAFGSYIAWSL